jgi:hypothetical protein
MIKNNNNKGILNNSGGGVMIIVAGVLVVFYLMAFSFGSRGWGYSGYYGYHRGPSFFYWGGPSMFHGPSVRTGSTGGPGHRGGGLGGGK